ncbi:MAG: hypothetical protein ABIY37_16645 [Devosia sp.]
MQAAVRTSISSLAAAGVIAGLFVIAAQRMFVVNPEALSIDAIALRILAGGGIYLGIFMIAHLILSRFHITLRPAYAVAGAAAMLASFQLGGGRELVPLASANGTMTLLYAVPLLWGALMGFIYRQSAGVAAGADDPHRLAAMLAGGTSQAARRQTALLNGEPRPGFGQRNAQNAEPSVSSDAAHVSTGEAEYFEGPLQVRTSMGAVLVTGVTAGVLWALVKAAFALLLMSRAGAGASMTGGAATSFLAATVGGTALLGAILMPIPVYVGHLIARSRGYTSYLSYAVIGALVPIGAGLAMFIAGVVFMAPYAIPCAIALVCYRYFAGLEPKSLPEDIEVRDRRTLVGANHDRRRYSRVVSR